MASITTITMLLLAILATLATAEQRFAETPAEYQEVSQGQDVKLRCRVQDKRGQCIWQKDRFALGMVHDKYEWDHGDAGECSLVIKRASLDYDDGLWECQVTPGDFVKQDGLRSPPARLLVRVEPRKPQMEYNGALLTTGLTLREGQDASISCTSRYGNPPALIKWFIGNEEVKPQREQSNATEVDKPKTWAAHSTLKVKGTRENHNKPIRCLTMHPTRALPEVVESRFDIHYSPTVHLETSPRMLVAALEDSASFVSLRCVANSNPPATIKWFKDGSPILMSSGHVQQIDGSQANATLAESEVRFEPIKAEDAGLYSCRAVNIIGESAPDHYRLDVQYGPKPRQQDQLDGHGHSTLNGQGMSSLGEIEETTSLGLNIEPFECPDFDANPPAQYRWLHQRGGSTDTIDNRNSEDSLNGGRRLRLENVGWSDEGEYRCVAYNVINGVRREMPSDVRFVLHVIGPPEIQSRPSAETEDGMYESIGWAGEAVHRLKSRFCSRPPPRIVAWQWGSSHIRAGESIGPKYEALELEPIIENKMATNCYWAKLEIRDLQREDARLYTLVVESDKGRDSTNLRLVVRDPTELRIIAAAGAVGLLVLLLLVAVAVYSCMRSRRNKHREYRQEDEEASISAEQYYGTQTAGAGAGAGNGQQQQTAGQQQAQVGQGQNGGTNGTTVLGVMGQQHVETIDRNSLKLGLDQQTIQRQHIVNQQQLQQCNLKSALVQNSGGMMSVSAGMYPRKQQSSSLASSNNTTTTMSGGSLVGIGGLAVMYDYDQIACKSRQAMSPEALKVRRAPAVLQPPTIV
ncbi:kin of IRRE-like protein 3 [Trichogramma pretiosum]|uniref:kin of IRRE-like protein 3 n=1 Tax=Trichogramma pretiosum TaxID=7493 RepID=UPI0006C9D8A7|nr:kin of IRRE-like protein 3 [Trichogramma pretiosum]